MLICASQLIRQLIAKYLDPTRSELKLALYLKSIPIRKSIVDKITINSILGSLAKKSTGDDLAELSEGAGPEYNDLLVSDVVDSFIEKDQSSNDLKGTLLKNLEDKMRVSEDDAQKILSNESISKEYQDKYEPQLVKILAKYLWTTLANASKEWFRERKDLVPEEEGSAKTPKKRAPEDAPLENLTVLENRMDDSLEEDEPSKYAGLMKKIFRLLQSTEPDAKKRLLYKLILKYRILGSKTIIENETKFVPKTISEIIEIYNKFTGQTIDKSLISRKESDLRTWIKDFLIGLGLGKADVPVKLQEGLPAAEAEINPPAAVGGIPKYTEFLKTRPEAQKDLENWLIEKGSGGFERSEKSNNILKLFSKGKTTKEVSDELGVPYANVNLVKQRVLNKQFSEWYKYWTEDLKKHAFSRIVKATLCNLNRYVLKGH